MPEKSRTTQGSLICSNLTICFIAFITALLSELYLGPKQCLNTCFIKIGLTFQLHFLAYLWLISTEFTKGNRMLAVTTRD